MAVLLGDQCSQRTPRLGQAVAGAV